MRHVPSLDEFLRLYPLMAIRPHKGEGLLLKGRFTFSAESPTRGRIEDEFALQITVPNSFPRELPQVTETGGRIPRTGTYHVNGGDGTLCLGSPFRLLLELSREPTLTGFASHCLVPYLYAISDKLRSPGPLAFDELAHGAAGILNDCVDLFNLRTQEQARSALKLLGVKKRLANKHPCPCGCGRRLGKCRFHFKLNALRKLASRSWFRGGCFR
jgi:hypothetical protein